MFSDQHYTLVLYILRLCGVSLVCIIFIGVYIILSTSFTHMGGKNVETQTASRKCSVINNINGGSVLFK